MLEVESAVCCHTAGGKSFLCCNLEFPNGSSVAEETEGSVQFTFPSHTVRAVHCSLWRLTRTGSLVLWEKDVVPVGSSQVSGLSCPSITYTPNPIFVC